jgi:hypothetical protein
VRAHAEKVSVRGKGRHWREPAWGEVVSPDAVMCFATRFRAATASTAELAAPVIPDDLTIPDFLRRPLQMELEMDLPLAA